MQITILKSKIHNARVTEANKDYQGSITIDVDLMNAALIYPYEQVHVWNITRGTRFVTYAIPANPESKGTICINGAAAHLVSPGERVIIATFTSIADIAAESFKPHIVVLDYDNNVKTVQQ